MPNDLELITDEDVNQNLSVWVTLACLDMKTHFLYLVFKNLFTFACELTYINGIVFPSILKPTNYFWVGGLREGR